MGFFVKTQVAENGLHEIHLKIVSNIGFSFILVKNKKNSHCNA